MASVTNRIKEIKQPKGGYLNPCLFNKQVLNDEKQLKSENVHPGIIGTVVDYMSRFMTYTNKRDAFAISLAGARLVFEDDMAEIFLSKINGLDDKSLIYACKLVGYDTAYRAGITSFKTVDNIEPNDDTLENIRIMVERSIKFFDEYGPVLADGFTFETDGYTSTVDSGDGDFMAKDTLWDFKTSKNEPTVNHTLQLVMYYIMGKHSGQRKYKNINKIGIFNPRLHIIYTYDMSIFPKDLIEEIEKNVICY